MLPTGPYIQLEVMEEPGHEELLYDQELMTTFFQ